MTTLSNVPIFVYYFFLSVRLSCNSLRIIYVLLVHENMIKVLLWLNFSSRLDHQSNVDVAFLQIKESMLSVFIHTE